jgi:anti-sigma factor RsiW
MNCKATEKHLIAYMDGSIDTLRRCEVEGHLSDCSACRQRAGELRQLWRVLDEAPVTMPSPGFDAQVRTRIAQEGARGGAWGWLIAPSPRLAVGVTALLIFSVWLSSVRPTAHPPQPVVASSAAEFRMIADLPVLEDYDVLADFEALSDLPVQAEAEVPPAPEQVPAELPQER